VKCPLATYPLICRRAGQSQRKSGAEHFAPHYRHYAFNGFGSKMPIAPRPKRCARRKAGGTGIGRDCLDRKAHPAAASIASAWRQWRNTLVSVWSGKASSTMLKEWWHFSLPGTAGRAYDLPVARRGK
jgi:hypothetical protein